MTFVGSYPLTFNFKSYMIITSRSNPLVKKIASLVDKKFRQQYGEYLVEGIKPVRECIASGGKIAEIVCTPRLEEEFKGAVVVEESVFKSISAEKTPQGVIALVKLPENAAVPPRGACLLLDRLQDPGNVGAIIRTANAAGYEDIYLVDCADAYSPKAVRASMSGIFFVNVMRCTLGEALAALDGIPLITADMSGENVFEFAPPEKFCLCIGNEGSGISSELFKRSSYTVSIPMRDSCESLNAAVSAAIAMYALKNNVKEVQ